MTTQSKQDQFLSVPGQIFDPQEFLDPPVEYRPHPSFFVNDRLSEAETTRHLEKIKSLGLGGLMLVAFDASWKKNEWDNFKGFRLDNYGSREYYRQITHLLKECERLDLKCWLWDDKGYSFPQIPDPSEKSLTFLKITLGVDGLASVNEVPWTNVPRKRLISTPGYGLDFFEFIHQNHIQLANLDAFRNVLMGFVNGEWHFEINHIPNPVFADRRAPGGKRDQVDIFNQFRRAPNDEIIVPADFPDLFELNFGYSCLEQIHLLFARHDQQLKDEEWQFLYDFYSFQFQRVLDCFFKPLVGRLEEQGYALAGWGQVKWLSFMATEINPISHYRTLTYQSGDSIYRNNYMGWENSSFALMATSAAHQVGRNIVLMNYMALNSFASTGKSLEWSSFFFLVRGVTCLNVQNCHYSIKDGGLLGDGCEYWDAWPLNDHSSGLWDCLGRCAYLMRMGEPWNPIAVYLPRANLICDFHEAINGAVEGTIKLLDNHQVTPDLVDEELLYNGRVENNCLVFGHARYACLIIPPVARLLPSVSRVLDQFATAGLPVYRMDAATGNGLYGPSSFRPLRVGEVKDVLFEHLGTDLTIKPDQAWAISCNQRLLSDGGHLLACFNHSNTDQPVELFCPADKPLFRIDPQTGSIVALDHATERVQQTIPAGKMRFFSNSNEFSSATRTNHQLSGMTAGRVVTIESDWKVGILREWKITKDGHCDVFEHDPPRIVVPALEKLIPWSSLGMEYFSGILQYEAGFDFSPKPAATYVLDLGEVLYSCQVRLNGNVAGSIISPAFQLDVTGQLKAGLNQLRVDVANTLANQINSFYTIQPDRFFDIDRSDIYHNWNQYMMFTCQWNRETMRSGLLGPVRLLEYN